MEPKPFASLSANLLARKGTARPAMRRAYVPGMATPTLPVSVQDDLGWNDMGEEKAPSAPPPLAMIRPDIEPSPEHVPAPEVVRKQAELAEQMIAPAEVKAARAPSTRAERSRAAKAAFTLRLDAERHLRLRLACALDNRSAQNIVTQALDAFLESQPQLEALAQHVPQVMKRGKPKSK